MLRSPASAILDRVPPPVDCPLGEWIQLARCHRRFRRAPPVRQDRSRWCAARHPIPDRYTTHISSIFHLRFSARRGAASLPERCVLSAAERTRPHPRSSLLSCFRRAPVPRIPGRAIRYRTAPAVRHWPSVLLVTLEFFASLRFPCSSGRATVSQR